MVSNTSFRIRKVCDFFLRNFLYKVFQVFIFTRQKGDLFVHVRVNGFFNDLGAYHDGISS